MHMTRHGNGMHMTKQRATRSMLLGIDVASTQDKNRLMEQDAIWRHIMTNSRALMWQRLETKWKPTKGGAT